MNAHDDIESYRGLLKALINETAMVPITKNGYRTKSGYSDLNRELAFAERIRLEKRLADTYIHGPLCPEELYQEAQRIQRQRHLDERKKRTEEMIAKAAEQIKNRFSHKSKDV